MDARVGDIDQYMRGRVLDDQGTRALVTVEHTQLRPEAAPKKNRMAGAALMLRLDDRFGGCRIGKSGKRAGGDPRHVSEQDGNCPRRVVANGCRSSCQARTEATFSVGRIHKLYAGRKQEV